ncbi:MAG: transposase, partial [Bacteroidota bacterium]
CKDVFVESLKYGQKHKGLLLYAWCIMTNHVHLIISSLDGFKQEDILRDLKYLRFTIIVEPSDRHARCHKMNKEFRH